MIQGGGISTRVNQKGDFKFYNLPPETFDVAAVLVQDGKIVSLDLKRVILADGLESSVELSVLK